MQFFKKKKRVGGTITEPAIDDPTKCSERDIGLELPLMEPIPSKSKTTILRERGGVKGERDRERPLHIKDWQWEGTIKGSHQHHRKRLTRKSDLE